MKGEKSHAEHAKELCVRLVVGADGKGAEEGDVR